MSRWIKANILYHSLVNPREMLSQQQSYNMGLSCQATQRQKVVVF